MKLRRWAVPALVMALAACGAPFAPQVAPVSDGEAPEPLKEGFPLDMQVYPDDNSYRLLAVEELPVVGVTTDSTAPGLPASRIVDGDYATQWVNGPYRAPTAWAAVQLANTTPIASIAIKTGVSPAGTRYDIQVSTDGQSWRTVLANQTNTSWAAEVKTLPAGTTGQYVRIFWHNSATNPVPHFGLYELVVNGETGTTPSTSPTTGPTPSPVPTSTSAPPSGTPTKLTPTSVTASSSYTGLPATRAIDGDSATQWASNGYKVPEESLTLAFANTVNFSQIKIKTGALPEGVTFKVDVSADGVNWEPASGRLTNRTWGMETQPVVGSGKFLKVRFFNSESAPIARFYIFEVEAYAGGTSGSTPAPTPTPSTGGTAAPTPSPGSAAAWYPDFIAIATQSYFVERVNGRVKLRFSTGIANVGPGHVQLIHNTSTSLATQEILDGSNRVIFRKGTTRLIYFAPHGHYHVADVARYTLRQGSLTGPIVRNSVKTSFCVEDSFKYRSTNEVARYPDCSISRSGLTRNYVDLYTPNLPGQDFDYTDLPKGDYYIVVEIDPFENFLDFRRTNNLSWARFALDAQAGTATRTAQFTP